jgi:hypothetical protein
MARMRPLGSTTPVLVCAECGRESEDTTAGWHAIRIDDPLDEDERPEIGFFCPVFARLASSAASRSGGVTRESVYE